jgi:hypothetical protein
MRKNHITVLLLFFLFCSHFLSFSQSLQLRHFGISTTIRNMHVGELLRYKSQGTRSFQTKIISAFGDSSIVFEDGSEVLLNELKKIRIKNNNHLTGTFSNAFLILSFLCFPLNTLNQLITQQQPVFSAPAAAVSAGLCGLSLALKATTIKNYRIGKHNDLKIIRSVFNDLSKQKTD